VNFGFWTFKSFKVLWHVGKKIILNYRESNHKFLIRDTTILQEIQSESIRGFYLKKVTKGVRRMPGLSEAKKDVTSCDKLRGLANTNRSAGFRMGQPIPSNRDIPGNRKANPLN
jgi:hypothetical protein